MFDELQNYIQLLESALSQSLELAKVYEQIIETKDNFIYFLVAFNVFQAIFGVLIFFLDDVIIFFDKIADFISDLHAPK